MSKRLTDIPTYLPSDPIDPMARRQVMDEWVELSPGGGALHVVVEYEPVGMEPQVNDVVFFEAFARSERSLVVPPNEPMVVRAVAGAFLLVGFKSPTARQEAAAFGGSPDAVPECRLRVHRNTVFVIERETLVDSAWYGVMDVTSVVGALPPGAYGVRLAGPPKCLSGVRDERGSLTPTLST